MQVLCGNGSLAEVVGDVHWIGWVLLDAYRMTCSQVVLWLYAVLGIVGNSLVIYWRCSRLRKSSKTKLESVLIVNLATGGLFCGLHRLLFQVSLRQCGAAEDRFPNTICQTGGWFFMAGGITTYFTTTIIAVYSFLSLINFKFWTHRIQKCSVYMAICVVWLLAVGAAFTYVFLFYKGYRLVPGKGYYADWTRCSPISWGLVSTNHSVGKNMYLTTFWLGNLLTLGLFILCCAITVRIFIIVRKGNKESKTTGMQEASCHERFNAYGTRRIVIVLVLVACVNVVSWLPPVFRHFVLMEKYQSLEEYTKSEAQFVTQWTLAGIIMQVQFVLDPVVYTLSSRRFCVCIHKTCWRIAQIWPRIKSRSRVGPIEVGIGQTGQTDQTYTTTTSIWMSGPGKPIDLAWAENLSVLESVTE
jgi:hypothetical protein